MRRIYGLWSSIDKLLINNINNIMIYGLWCNMLCTVYWSTPLSFFFYLLEMIDYYYIWYHISWKDIPRHAILLFLAYQLMNLLDSRSWFVENVILLYKDIMSKITQNICHHYWMKYYFNHHWPISWRLSHLVVLNLTFFDVLVLILSKWKFHNSWSLNMIWCQIVESWTIC